MIGLFKRSIGSMFGAAMLLALIFSPSSAFDGPSFQGQPRPVTELEENFQVSVFKGWRSFQTSYARDGLACVHCHPGYARIRLWYGAYPKVEVFDGTPYRVKRLREVVAEALEKHSDLSPGEREKLVGDLVSYIAWWGDGVEVLPGHSSPYPPALVDLGNLRNSVERGRIYFSEEKMGPCSGCHVGRVKGKGPDGVEMDGLAVNFPRFVSPPGRVLGIDDYLKWHIEDLGHGDPPGDAVITDLVAYLFSLAEGKKLNPGRSDR